MNHATILVGDVRERLREMPDGSVRTCITSPPYWGLRDYGTATWIGGNPACDHLAGPLASDKNTLGGGKGQVGDGYKVQAFGTPFKGDCRKCGALRIDSQIGLEQTPDEYVKQMVAVFREVRRVLRDDGTVWLNLGDSYKPSGNGSTKKGLNERYFGRAFASDKQGADEGHVDRSRLTSEGVKPKDLVGIPWRVAFALQADGWYLRSDIIWAKPNPMPESVTDRPTKAHEYVFLLSKSARYFYDAEASAEPSVGRELFGNTGGKQLGNVDRNDGGRRDMTPTETRNRRSVWNVATKPFSGAHFAVMPEALVEPCVLAGSASGDTVLDPFTGSGTVAVVALRHGRNFIGVELNPAYAVIAHNRITDDAPLFNTVTIDAPATVVA